jgi:hypothetical protein
MFLLTFAPAAPATVEGPWIATMVNNGQGAVSSVPAGVTGAMSFLRQRDDRRLRRLQQLQRQLHGQGRLDHDRATDVHDDGLPRSGRIL